MDNLYIYREYILTAMFPGISPEKLADMEKLIERYFDPYDSGGFTANELEQLSVIIEGYFKQLDIDCSDCPEDSDIEFDLTLE